MRNFSFRIFFIIALLLSVMAFMSFNAAMRRDEGKIGASAFRNFLADMFNVLRFPTHVLPGGFFDSPLMFAVGLIINCFIYAFILERLVFIIFKIFFFRSESDAE